MYRKLIVLLVGSALATSASAGERHRAHKAERAAKHESIGLGSGAAIGALAGGPVGLIIGAAMGGWLGDRFHHERDARRGRAERGARRVRAKALERGSSSERAAAEAGAAPSGERAQHRRDVEEALSIDVHFRTEDSTIDPATSSGSRSSCVHGASRRHRDPSRRAHGRARHAAVQRRAVDCARRIRARHSPARGHAGRANRRDGRGVGRRRRPIKDADGMALDRRVAVTVVGLDDASRVARDALVPAPPAASSGRSWPGAAADGSAVASGHASSPRSKLRGDRAALR